MPRVLVVDGGESEGGRDEGVSEDGEDGEVSEADSEVSEDRQDSGLVGEDRTLDWAEVSFCAARRRRRRFLGLRTVRFAESAFSLFAIGTLIVFERSCIAIFLCLCRVAFCCCLFFSLAITPGFSDMLQTSHYYPL